MSAGANPPVLEISAQHHSGRWRWSTVVSRCSVHPANAHGTGNLRDTQMLASALQRWAVLLVNVAPTCVRKWAGWVSWVNSGYAKWISIKSEGRNEKRHRAAVKPTKSWPWPVIWWLIRWGQVGRTRGGDASSWVDPRGSRIQRCGLHGASSGVVPTGTETLKY